MAAQKNGDFLKDLNPFSFGLPSSLPLIAVLLMISLIMGIGATALLNYRTLPGSPYYIIANGSLTGILIIMMPALLTVIVIKLFKRYIDLKYILFVAIIGAFCYSLFILLSAILHIVLGNYTVAGLVILVGNASIFGWWFFANKIMLVKKKIDLVFAFAQPTFNILLYFPYSSRIISFATPFNILIIKLYAGIFIFLIICYTIIYLVDRPYRKSFGFRSFDAFAQLLQNWLFDANTAAPFGSTKFGKPGDVTTDTLTLKDTKGKIKAVFFAPDIHYGPAGTIGGSDFPYMLERHIGEKYNAPGFIMHRAVDMDSNPVSSTQFGRVRDSLDKGVGDSKQLHGGLSYTESVCGDSQVSRLGIGGLSLVTLTRAPRVTEDVAQPAAALFSEVLESKFGPSVIVDAHNSRLESAPKEELDGVKFKSRFAEEYIRAMKAMGKPWHSSKSMRFGAARQELYDELGAPTDLARGNLNVAIFGFNGYKRALVQMNGNNMLPSMRKKLIAYMKKKFKVEAEVYTTDTHAVNSLGFEADNVVGRKTSFDRLRPILDACTRRALDDMEEARAYHRRDVLQNFMIWGQNSMENIITVAKSVYDFTKVLVPVTIVLGFIIAAWVISVV
jgi:predicted neutral ceramidase superfamily lipid hydrolase